MRMLRFVPALTVVAALVIATSAAAAPGNVGFGLNARDISGFPTGSATLTGGGAYDPVSGFVNSADGFRCTSDKLTASTGPHCAPTVRAYALVELRDSKAIHLFLRVKAPRGA
jgi:hypothetical protein